MFEQYGLDSFIVISTLRRNSNEQKFLIEYMIENNIPLITFGKLNPILNISNKEIKDFYGIDIKGLMKEVKHVG